MVNIIVYLKAPLRKEQENIVVAVGNNTDFENARFVEEL